MDENSFEVLYEQSLNSKKIEKTIIGKVIDISSKCEIFVDFGYKADGIIPLLEYSDAEFKDPKEEFKSGDTITADVLKWNDGLGNVLLSYKRVAKREKEKKEKLIREKEFKQRQEQRQLKAKNMEEFWNNIKIGQAYTGKISKVTNFGIFVDLGIKHGLLHISEITWNRDENLADRFEIGETIEVVIKSFNREEDKISLIYPLKGDNPWYALSNKYNINDIITGTVIKFVPFGAFIEIENGLEGLVHNSEITSIKRISKPEEKLKIGQIINAKIINIDKEKCKVSLSIKELEGTSSEYGYEEFIKEI